MHKLLDIIKNNLKKYKMRNRIESHSNQNIGY